MTRIKQAAHTATAAIGNELAKQNCRDCPRNVKWCRGANPLNGPDSAAELTRNLRPWARAQVLHEGNA